MPHLVATSRASSNSGTRPAESGRLRAVAVMALGGLLLATAGSGRAALVIPTDILAVQQLQAHAVISLASTVVAQDIDGVLASTDFATSWARSDSADGTLRGLAQASNSTHPTLHSSAGLGLQLQNISAHPASFAAGALRIDVHGSFGRNLPGAGSLGVAGNTLVATLGVVILNQAGMERDSGAMSLIYTWTSEPGAAAPRISAAPETAGSLGSSFTLSGLEFDGSSLQAVVAAPALQLLPGETLTIAADTNGGAVAVVLGGGGAVNATTDYGNTARLALALPAGFGLQSPQPLDWVVSSPVPEPSAAMLLAAGLALLAWRRQRAPAWVSGAPGPLH